MGKNSYFAPGRYDDHTEAMMIDCFLFRSTKHTLWLVDQTVFSRVCERAASLSFQTFYLDWKTSLCRHTADVSHRKSPFVNGAAFNIFRGGREQFVFSI